MEMTRLEHTVGRAVVYFNYLRINVPQAGLTCLYLYHWDVCLKLTFFILLRRSTTANVWQSIRVVLLAFRRL